MLIEIAWMLLAALMALGFMVLALYSWDAKAETFITVYLQKDGCGQYEYTELQVPMGNVFCDEAGCKALLNGTWRPVLLKKP